jgi:IS5 family transposase
MKKDAPEYLDICQYFLRDKGYDSQPLIDRLKDAGIKPVIDIRNCRKDGEETHQYRDTDLVYN